ncbi:MAG: CHASE4 domain-containing protein [Methanosarcina sp.]
MVEIDISRKVSILTILVFIVLTAVFTFAYNIQFSNLLNLEKEDTLENVERIQNAVSTEQEYLNFLVRDWACWDDTYIFIEDRDPRFIDVNVQNETLVGLKVNIMLFVNNSGSVVYAKAVDINSGQEKPVPDKLLRLIENKTLLTKGQNDTISGFILLDEVPIFVACHPILTTKFQGPSKGTLIFGRYFDINLISTFKEVDSSLLIYRVDREVPPDLQAKVDNFSKLPGRILVEPLNENRIAGYFELKDVLNNPALIMRVDFPRKFYLHGTQILNWMYCLLLLSGLMTGIGVKIALDRLFVSRLVGIDSFIAGVRSEKDFAKRLPLKDNDELYRLSREINGMLNEIYLTKQEYLKEQELKVQEKEKKILLDSLSELVVFVGPQLDFVWANKAALKYMKMSLQETVGINLKDIPGGSCPFCECTQIEQIFLTGNKRSWEFSAQDRSTWFVQANPVADEDGKIIGILETCRNITERKETEKLLQEKQLAEIANRTKSEFLANMSHELRTPLNSIIGFSDLLYEQAYGELNKKQLRSIRNISQSGKHLLSLINNILDLSKIEAGKMELDYKEFELENKLRGLKNLLSPIADKKDIRILIEVDSKLTTVNADEARFAQIMYNLLDNAIKFSHKNGFIKITARKKGKFAEITVKDSGAGIKPEDQKKLFKPFSQVDSFSSKEYQGAGLGLSLVKQIVHLHHGYIWFKSKPGEGSIFAFAIPINGNKGNTENL